ncbi:general negative regulator of transcription subunit 5 [Scheffersomyces spartinae]|uniref:General negative regulator of transcription subunit n=1 Tax=Scheffersomyces spartinae TaxID=45513 RepID=A0A9P7V927_9ASCO|nr:general negative regulator of transcription subunit 5 [Scheffersomyces spartinae]KAG7193459.1 general negative regulator of transcription subunit 5 [Scheffersomyces spartinae]
MSARKLQQEFDKTNKKISEGLQSFEDIYDKLISTEGSQREKLENDLKKEIKKLQRLREQLKVWLADSSIKLDKDMLQDNRTKIEHAMDLFKDQEKLSKIKQFSNEGLELQAQRKHGGKFGGVVDSDDAKKYEACEYISDVIEKINQQNEALEGEVHQLTLQLKKIKATNASSLQSSLDDVKYKIERNATHLTHLETILRALENEKLDPDDIEKIKEDLEYYVENNQEEDYVEYDDFYDLLEIDDGVIEVQGSLSALAVGEKDDTAPATSTTAATAASGAPVGTGTSSSVSVATAAADTSIKTEKPSTIPPPINSYSSVIGAAASKGLGQSQGQATVSLMGGIVGGAPPGLAKTSGRSIGAALTPSTSKEDTGVVRSTFGVGSVSPTRGGAGGAGAGGEEGGVGGALETGNLFVDTIPNLSAMAQNRLLNPLPLLSIGSLLETSLLNCPDSFDAEKPRHYQPVNMHPSSVDYPQEPMYELNSASMIHKFDTDTLFFCFYYGEGVDNLAKWNASRELARRGWLFNRETKQWFLRDQGNGKKRTMSVIQREGSQPPEDSGVEVTTVEDKDVDLDKEHNFKYFDYEKTWLTRRKENYKFPKEYREVF